jgi:hypothetical protein
LRGDKPNARATASAACPREVAASGQKRSGAHTPRAPLARIASIARSHNVELICHGVGSPTYHFLISNGPTLSPRCEYLDIYDGGSETWVLSDDPRPREGRLALADAPGFGYDINESAFSEGVTVAPIW